MPTLETIASWLISCLVGVAGAFGAAKVRIKSLDKRVDDFKEEFDACKETCIKAPVFTQFEKRFEEAIENVQGHIEQVNSSNEMIIKELLNIKSELKKGGRYVE